MLPTCQPIDFPLEASMAGLLRVWKHSPLQQSRKLTIFDSVIMSKLRYSIGSAWLNKGSFCKLGGLHASCLRKVLGILQDSIGIYWNLKKIVRKCNNLENVQNVENLNETYQNEVLCSGSCSHT